MAGARSTSTWIDRTCLAVLLVALGLGGSMVYSQSTSDTAPPVSRPPLFSDSPSARDRNDFRSPEVPDDARPVNSRTAPAAGQEMVVQVRVTGNSKVPVEKILAHIRTRAGRSFDPEQIEEDVRRLNNTHMFVQVKPYSQKVEGGRVVIFEVLERPILHYVKYVGNQKIKKKKLEKESGIKAGDSLDTFAVEEARRRLEEYYHSHGFPKASVKLVEGDRPEDRGAIFLINEGQKQRILWTDFVGNEIASDARLRTQIQQKPGILWLFKGEVDRKQIEEDINRLTSYYRSLGFFRARVGRELHFNENESWLSLTYVIDEGPRYKVRNVSVIGNTKFPSEELLANIKLKDGKYFNQGEMKADQMAMQDIYGAKGYVFARIEPDPRFLEEPGTIDLVYNVSEGEQFRVGRINVKIKGEFPHTRINTVLNRMSIHPGDIVDTRELRNSERRLKASGLFETDPATGSVPKIVFSPPDMDGNTEVARNPKKPGNVRGQSPDPPAITIAGPPPTAHFNPNERLLDLTIEGISSGRDALPEEEPVPPVVRRLPPPGPVATQCPIAAEQPQPVMDLRPVVRRPAAGSVDWQLDQAEDALRRLVGTPQVEPALTPVGPYPVQPASYAPPAQPMPVPRDEPLRGDFGWPTQPVVRFQYSGDSGRAVPALPQSQGWTNRTRATPVSGTQTPSQTTLPAPTGLSYSAGSALPPSNSAATMAPVSPPVGSQVVSREPYAPPIDSYPVPQLTSGGPTVADAAALNGASPDEQPLWLPLDPTVTEARTGRLMFSVGVNSEAGLLGSVIIDEQNFDILNPATSWEDIRNGTAWRGAGQRFRVEAVPGTELQRYTVTFQEPYLLDTRVSLSLNGFYYDRQFTEWMEQRIGGRVGLGYQLAPDLTVSARFRGESVRITDPIIPPPNTPAQLAEVLGQNSLYGFQLSLARDTRDSQFLPTEGSLIEVSAEQVVGSFEYPRFDLDVRKYFLIAQRPDTSGRQVLSLSGRLAVTGDNTPIYEHYFAGGFSTLRGFDFRGASPREAMFGTLVGGEFMALASAEYMFPITADDMIRGVVFVDTGTVEPTIGDWTDRYRVAPGVGLRITIPAMGPAPIALDLAVPISHEHGDEIENFSFFVGFLR